MRNLPKIFLRIFENVTLCSCGSATVMDYLRAHDEKMLAQMGLDMNHKDMVNHWSGGDKSRSQPGDVVAGTSQPAPLVKIRSSAAATVATATTTRRGGAGEILIYLLRLRQCCSHLSILRDVSVFTPLIMFGMIILRHDVIYIHIYQKINIL